MNSEVCILNHYIGSDRVELPNMMFSGTHVLNCSGSDRTYPQFPVYRDNTICTLRNVKSTCVVQKEIY